MPVMRFSFKFTSATYGWSENWFGNYPTLASGLVVAGLHLPFRLALLLNTARCVGYSVRLMGAPFTSRSTVLPPPSGTGTQTPLAGAGGEPPFSALYLQARSNGDRVRQVHLRGVPTEIIGSEGQYTPQAAFTVALNAWIANLIAAFQVGVQSYSEDRAITSIAIAGGTQQNLTVGYDGAAIAFVAGDLVQLSGVTSPRGVNKVMRVAVDASASPVTLGPYPFPLAGVWPGGGRFRKLDVWTAEALSSVVPLRGGKRSTGRPSSLPVGRRKAR